MGAITVRAGPEPVSRGSQCGYTCPAGDTRLTVRVLGIIYTCPPVPGRHVISTYGTSTVTAKGVDNIRDTQLGGLVSKDP